MSPVEKRPSWMSTESTLEIESLGTLNEPLKSDQSLAAKDVLKKKITYEANTIILEMFAKPNGPTIRREKTNLVKGKRSLQSKSGSLHFRYLFAILDSRYFSLLVALCLATRVLLHSSRLSKEFIERKEPYYPLQQKAPSLEEFATPLE
eukprot:Gb_26681 [translate_table: standard]